MARTKRKIRRPTVAAIRERMGAVTAATAPMPSVIGRAATVGLPLPLSLPAELLLFGEIDAEERSEAVAAGAGVAGDAVAVLPPLSAAEFVGEAAVEAGAAEAVVGE